MNLDIAAALCRMFEGLFLRPYICPAGYPTIGYGSRFYADGREVTMADLPITREQAEAMLMRDLRMVYALGVLRQCPRLALYPERFNAIVDFAYNLGVGRLQTSTLRRKINAEDWEGAKAELMRWVRGGGRVLPGLVKRRGAERVLM